jgi:hypothetical protein
LRAWDPGRFHPNMVLHIKMPRRTKTTIRRRMCQWKRCSLCKMEARNKDHAVVKYEKRYVRMAALQLIDFFDFLSAGEDMSPPSCAFATILLISARISCRLVFNVFASSNLRCALASSMKDSRRASCSSRGCSTCASSESGSMTVSSTGVV